MNYERAEQIFNAEDIIEVLYNGSAVWIEELNEDNQTAMVLTDDSDTPQEVSVGELKEQGTH